MWGVVNISEETCTSTIQRWHNKSAIKHPVSIAFTFYTMKYVKHVLNSIYFQELPNKQTLLHICQLIFTLQRNKLCYLTQSVCHKQQVFH